MGKGGQIVVRVIAGLIMILVGLIGLAPQIHRRFPSVTELTIDVAIAVCSMGLIGAGIMFPFGKARIGFWVGVLLAAAAIAHSAVFLHKWHL